MAGPVLWLDVEWRTGKLKVGQTTAGQEHWHSQTVPPFGPEIGETNLESNL